jgi:acetate kinase
MVAVFDTAFDATMPDRASWYAIDHRLAHARWSSASPR